MRSQPGQHEPTRSTKSWTPNQQEITPHTTMSHSDSTNTTSGSIYDHQAIPVKNNGEAMLLIAAILSMVGAAIVGMAVAMVYVGAGSGAILITPNLIFIGGGLLIAGIAGVVGITALSLV